MSTCYEKLRNNLDAGEYLKRIEEHFKNQESKPKELRKNDNKLF